MDRRRLADVRAGSLGRPQIGGTGYLIGLRLVLTARHVVVGEHGKPWPRVQVRLGHPGDGPVQRHSAKVVWQHPDPARDVALLQIDSAPFTEGSQVRWGWFVSARPLEYIGLGFPQFANYESGRGVEQLTGVLPPLALGIDNGYVLDEAAAPDRQAGRAWPGVSGAAVFCDGLLTGVVFKDDLAFGNRRLHAVPAHVLLADSKFIKLVEQDVGVPTVLEAVELKRFFQRPTVDAHVIEQGCCSGN